MALASKGSEHELTMRCGGALGLTMQALAVIALSLALSLVSSALALALALLGAASNCEHHQVHVPIDKEKVAGAAAPTSDLHCEESPRTRLKKPSPIHPCLFLSAV